MPAAYGPGHYGPGATCIFVFIIIWIFVYPCNINIQIFTMRAHEGAFTMYLCMYPRNTNVHNVYNTYLLFIHVFIF